MTSGVRVAAAGTVVVALLLGPKITVAVAIPMVGASQPAVAHVLTAFPQAVTSQMVATKTSAAKTPVATPVRETDLNTVSEGASMPMAISTPQVGVEPLVLPKVEVNAGISSVQSAQAAGEVAPPKGIAYLDGMRAAGYPLDLNNDLNTLVAMRSLGVTPEYARSMGTVGLGRPTVHELITLKSLGVTPEYVAEMKQSGLGPKDFHEIVTEKSLGITPEYAAAMKQKGFGNLDLHQLITLKAQGMTPEYAGWLKQQFPQSTFEELKRAATFHLDEKFIAQAKTHGFDEKDLDKLLRLKISGLLDE